MQANPQTRVFLAVLLGLSSVLGAPCMVKYQNWGKPLLFGGVSERCSAGCQPRDADDWGKICAFDHNSDVWGACSPDQLKSNFDYAKSLGRGEAANMSPCDLVTFLRGRTLWLLGYIVSKSPCDLGTFLRGRTLWLLGDSHSKSFYRALQCFLFDFWDHTECMASPNADDVTALKQLPAAEGTSNCFHLIGPGGGRVCMVHVVLATSLLGNMDVEEGGVLPLLRTRFAQPQDIFAVSIGSWHRKTTEWGAIYQPSLDALGAYYQATKSDWPHLLFRETPAIHPMDYPTNTCLPLEGYSYNRDTGALQISGSPGNASMTWYNGLTINNQAKESMKKWNIPVVPAYNISAPLVDNHIGTRLSPSLDCLHYCQPGVPEMWIYYLYKSFKAGKSGIVPLPVPPPAAANSNSSNNSSSAVSVAAATPTPQPRQMRIHTAAAAAAAAAVAEATAAGKVFSGQYTCVPSPIRFR